jgi:hypothetical protein
MTNIVAALLAGAGVVTAIVGLIIRQRAIKRYGNGAKAGWWLPVWRCDEWFTDVKGKREFLLGYTLLIDGLFLALVVMAYATGRGW